MHAVTPEVRSSPERAHPRQAGQDRDRKRALVAGLERVAERVEQLKEQLVRDLAVREVTERGEGARLQLGVMLEADAADERQPSGPPDVDVVCGSVSWLMSMRRQRTLAQ
jgi:hypothetical protein